MGDSQNENDNLNDDIFYKYMGISTNPTLAEIKKAYHKLSLTTNPDKCPPDKQEQATEEFKILLDVYKYLIEKHSGGLHSEHKTNSGSAGSGSSGTHHGESSQSKDEDSRSKHHGESSRSKDEESRSKHHGESSRSKDKESRSKHHGESSQSKDEESRSKHHGESSKSKDEDSRSKHHGESSQSKDEESRSKHHGESSKSKDEDSRSKHHGESSQSKDEDSRSKHHGESSQSKESRSKHHGESSKSKDEDSRSKHHGESSQSKESRSKHHGESSKSRDSSQSKDKESRSKHHGESSKSRDSSQSKDKESRSKHHGESSKSKESRSKHHGESSKSKDKESRSKRHGESSKSKDSRSKRQRDGSSIKVIAFVDLTIDEDLNEVIINSAPKNDLNVNKRSVEVEPGELNTNGQNEVIINSAPKNDLNDDQSSVEATPDTNSMDVEPGELNTNDLNVNKRLVEVEPGELNTNGQNEVIINSAPKNDLNDDQSSVEADKNSMDVEPNIDTIELNVNKRSVEVEPGELNTNGQNEVIINSAPKNDLNDDQSSVEADKNSVEVEPNIDTIELNVNKRSVEVEPGELNTNGQNEVIINSAPKNDLNDDQSSVEADKNSVEVEPNIDTIKNPNRNANSVRSKHKTPKKIIRKFDGARSTTNSMRTAHLVDKFYNSAIAAQFANLKFDSIEMEMPVSEAAALEAKLWHETIEILKSHTNRNKIYISPTIWGAACANVKTSKRKYKSGTQNVNFVEHYSTKVSTMNSEMLNKFKEGKEIVIFHVSSLFNIEESRYVNHSNVLVCRMVENTKKFLLYEPAEVTKINDVKIMSFVREQICRHRGIPSLKKLELVFGTQQRGEWDCLHRCCDYVAKIATIENFLKDEKPQYYFDGSCGKSGQVFKID